MKNNKQNTLLAGAAGMIVGGFVLWIDSGTLSFTLWGALAGAMVGATLGSAYVSSRPNEKSDDQFSDNNKPAPTAIDQTLSQKRKYQSTDDANLSSDERAEPKSTSLGKRRRFSKQ